jgi:hypothetical protein
MIVRSPDRPQMVVVLCRFGYQMLWIAWTDNFCPCQVPGKVHPLLPISFWEQSCACSHSANKWARQDVRSVDSFEQFRYKYVFIAIPIQPPALRRRGFNPNETWWE